MINVRYAIDKDIDDIKKIWSYCFGDTEKFMDYYFSYDKICIIIL